MPFDVLELEAKEKMGGYAPLSDKVPFHPFLASPALETATVDRRTLGTPSIWVTGPF
jgi:hypothetical protein